MKTVAYSDLFAEKLVDLNITADSEGQAFEIVADRLELLGLVHKSYRQGIQEREKVFPTGLITQFLNVALPHTDTEHVKKPFVYIARIDKGIAVRTMGDNQEILVRDLFFLGIKNPKEQVGLLQLLVNLFRDKEFMQEFKRCSDSQQMHSLFIQHI